MSASGFALVVGGTRGLGRVVVERFLARGVPVAVLSRNAPPPGHWGVDVRHVPADLEALRDADAASALVKAVGGPLRYVVFCQRYRGSGDAWTGEMQVSVRATDLLIRAAGRYFVEDGDRALVAVSSVYADFVGSSQPASYHVAKAGLNQLVRYHAWTLGRQGIRLNAVMPLTYLKSESRNHYLGNAPLMELYRRFVPLGRIGGAEECADAIDFFCSTKSSFITGQCLYVDGGTSIVWQEELAKGLSGL
jgi:NAD(P)-dependent dehydrogenase (short-subunit alcohol dehydrogenase family)